MTEAVPQISDIQQKLFGLCVKNLRLAIKNSVFYEPNHPLFASSMSNLKKALDNWFKKWDQLNIGISEDSLFLNGNAVSESNGFHRDVAHFFHMRGLVAVSFKKGLELDELTRLFRFVRLDRKTIKAKGGIRKHIPKQGHIAIKEIDYSTLLKTEKKKMETDENKVWQFLFQTAKESKKGELPESKVEFLIDFFRDAEKSAAALNKLYRDAVNQLNEEMSVDDIYRVIAQLCTYLDQRSDKDAKEIKTNLMTVISQLHPDLVSMLFEENKIGSEEFDLVESITKDFSENYIAEFIESLISNEDSFNENLLKVFDKLAPDSEQADSVISMVADKLFAKRVANPDMLSKLQMSIRDIFQRHPDSNFMNQIYKITVDAVVNKKIDTLVYVARLTPLINKFVQSIEDGQLKKEEIWLLLNILWLENEADEFKKFTDKVVRILPDLLDTKDTERLKEIVEFFAEKTRPDQRRNKLMNKEISAGLQRITNSETLHSIIAQIPEASNKDLNDIAYILNKADMQSAKLLVNAFLENKNPAHRNKFRLLFFRMKPLIAKDVVERFQYCDPQQVHDLFIILKECSMKKAHLMSRRLIQHKNPQVRWEALEGFLPKTEEEIEEVLKLFCREKNEGVKKKAAAVLLNTRQPEVIQSLFQKASNTWFKRKFLLQLVDLCGQCRVSETFDPLKKIFARKSILQSKKHDDLRVAALTSLARLHTSEAISLVESALQDKSKRVREMSEIILQLDE